MRRLRSLCYIINVSFRELAIEAQRIRLNPAVAITKTTAGVLIHSDLDLLQLGGADTAAFLDVVIPLLDGQWSAEQIAEKLPGYSNESVLELIRALRTRGVVISAQQPEFITDGPAQFFRAWSLEPATAAERLQAAHFVVVGIEPWGAAVCSSLADAGAGTLWVVDDNAPIRREDLHGATPWRREDEGSPRGEALVTRLRAVHPGRNIHFVPLKLIRDEEWDVPFTRADLIVACLRGDELKLLSAIARFAHKQEIPSLYGCMEDFSAVAGPLVIPGKTPCWNCTRLRILANAQKPEVTHSLQAALLQERPKPRVSTYLPAMTSLLGQLLGIEAVKHVTRYGASTLAGNQLLQNVISLETSRHSILRMPWCEVCGGAIQHAAPSGGPALNPDAPASPILEEAASPEQLREMLRGVVDERTGIVSQLVVHPAEVDEPEIPITCSAGLCAYTDGHYRDKTPEIGSGKSLSVVGAMIGAAGEGVERYSAARFRKSDMRRARMTELEGDRLDPAKLSLYNEDRYGDPEFPFRPFDPEQPVEWVRGHWLASDRPVWLPALPVYFNVHVPIKERFCQVSSNGLAAGSDHEDASWRATLELLERDTFMLSWLAQVNARKVTFDDGMDGNIREVIRQLERTGAQIECCALDVGTRIPAMACLAWGDGQTWPGVTVSLAAHTSWKGAIHKSILEQGHVGPYIRRLSRKADTKLPSQTSEVKSLIDHALYYVDPGHATAVKFLTQGGEVSYRELAQTPELTREECLAKLESAGLRIAIADVTSPDLLSTPFRVARALGENIQPIDFGYHMRRLSNPRLSALLQGRDPNTAPHPIA
jgi:ribosomal protein S12 methylthiotransferase accessory factor